MMGIGKRKRFLKFGLVISLVLSLLASPLTDEASTKDMGTNIPESIIADWKFSQDYIKSGSIEEGNLIIEDASGHENNLELTTVGSSPSSQAANTLLQWSEDDYFNSEDVESMTFHNTKQSPVGRYFKTTENAPINDEKFADGFTIEAVIKLPEDLPPEKHGWMGILTSQGQATDMNKLEGEKEILSTLSVSSLNEIQWISHPSNHKINIKNRSFILDSTKDWYHIVVVNDGTHTKLYINGVTDFRNTEDVSIRMDGVAGKGWNVGASEWANKIDSLFAGSIQEIRIANKPLPQDNWIIRNYSDGHVKNGTNVNIPLLTNKDHYNFVFVPDPQKTVRYMPEIFAEQTNWIAQNEKKLNLAMTAFLGDMVDQSNAVEEWENSHNSIATLDKQKTPYITIAGNHDYGPNDPYLTYYGPERFADKEYFKGAAPSGFSTYSIITAGSYDYLFLTVDMGHIKEDIPWAKEVLKKYPNTPTILLSHQIINIGGDGKSPIDTANGSLLWDELINENNQVFMTVSGHHHGAAHRIKQNALGNDVIQVLVDYQSGYHGGNGWMRFAEFNEIDNKISFKTYSPWVEKLPKPKRTYFDVKYLIGESDQFEIPFSFKNRFDFAN